MDVFDSPPGAGAPLDKDDLWFLEVVVELLTPLAMLKDGEVAQVVCMRRGHGLSPEALCEKLASLSERGLIRVHRSEDEGQVVRTRAELELALAWSTRHPPHDFVYGLTEKGGAAWEHHARPDWSRYVGMEWSHAPEECVIEAASREAVEQEYQRHERSGDEYRPLPESKRGEELVPWRATYWKTLPTGYRLRYAWVPRPPDVRRTMSAPPRVPWYTSLPLDR